MSRTTVTVTDELKSHFKDIKTLRGCSSFNDAIISVLDTPMQEEFDVPEGNMMENPGPMKISKETQTRLQAELDASEWDTYEDLLRDKTGATPRDYGEQPVEWEPL